MNDNEQGTSTPLESAREKIVGRPTIKTPELCAEMLNCIETGLSVYEACEKCKVTPSKWYAWLTKDEELREHYARAKDISDDVQAEDIVKLAERINKDPQADANKGRLLVDAKKWKLAKTAAKKYGEHQRIELDGKLDVAVDASDVILKDFLAGIEKKGGAQGGQ